MDVDEPRTLAVVGRARPVAISLGLSGAALTIAIYLVGASRGFGYDSAVTVHQFIRTDSLADALTRQVVYNNHPLFSALSWVAREALGFDTELTLRILPAVFAGTSVGILGFALARRWGWAPGVAAMMLLATNPLFVSTSREVRGYSLLVLCCILSSLCVLRGQHGRRTSSVTAVGVATHLYAVGALAAQATWLASRRQLSKAWCMTLGLGLAVGAAMYLPLLDVMLGTSRGRVFRQDFPLELAWEALGANWPALILTTLLVLRGVQLALNRHPPPQVVWAMVTFGVLAMLGPWLVFQPFDLYPRFYVWAVPLLAVAIARSVAHDRRLLLVAGVAALATIAPQLGHWSTPDLPNRQAGESLADFAGEVCLLGWSAEAGAVYLPDARWVGSSHSLTGCDAAVVLVSDAHPELMVEARQRFATETTIADARRAGAVFTDPQGTTEGDGV